MIKIIIEFKNPDPAKTVKEILAEAGHMIKAPCGGNGTCGKCSVKLDGNLTQPDEAERKLLGDDFSRGFRLACRVHPTGDFTAETDDAIYNNMKIMTEITASNEDFTPVADGFGAAVDLGTTTVALYIVDLSNGDVVYKSGFPNPQSPWGADVISRIGYISQNPEGLEKLKTAVLHSIETEIIRSGVEFGKIKYMTLAGNTVMQHIFRGLDPTSIATAPFTPKSLFGDTSVTDFESFSCPVYAMPCAASYVGGDILSGLCASDIDISDGLTLYLDIGTNGELALGGKDGIVTCACAAGPAFEGANLSCGMPGIDGAVCKIKSINENGACFETIGDKAPAGICGSAVIDLTAKLLDAGIIEDSGFMEEDYRLDPESNICLTPRDVREIQLAKAAVAAACLTLLKRCGKTPDYIERVVLAGGFGSYISKTSACRIGLFPGIAEDKIKSVGNASGSGAVRYLVSRSFRERIKRLSETASYIELSGDAVFMEKYVDQMMFEE